MRTDYRKKSKPVKSAWSAPDLGPAYDLVLPDLFNKLTKIKEGTIKLGELGTFRKKHRIMQSALNGRTYAYYQVSFKASVKLKKALDKKNG